MIHPLLIIWRLVIGSLGIVIVDEHFRTHPQALTRIDDDASLSFGDESITLQGINISHLGKRKIIFKMPFLGDMLVSWRVTKIHVSSFFLWTVLLSERSFSKVLGRPYKSGKVGEGSCPHFYDETPLPNVVLWLMPEAPPKKIAWSNQIVRKKRVCFPLHLTVESEGLQGSPNLKAMVIVIGICWIPGRGWSNPTKNTSLKQPLLCLLWTVWFTS